MSQSLVRVSVLADRRRVDVCLPAEVPVIQILPDLVRGLAAGSSQGGMPRLVTVEGALLDPEQGLRVQGVSDGEMLTLARDSEHVPRRVHDDLVEAVHERSRSNFRSWTHQSSRIAAQAVACVAGLFGAGLLATAAVNELTVVVALVSAVMAGLLATGLSRVVQDGIEHVGVAWLASLYWGVAGGHIADHLGFGEQRLVAAAACAGTMGVLCLVLSRTHWPLLAAPVIVALSLVLAQTVASLLLVSAWKVLLAGVVAGVLLARLLPGVVVELTVVRGQEVSARDRGRAPRRAQSPGVRRRVTRAAPPGVDLPALDRDLRVAHSTVLALGVSGSVLMVALVPAVVRSGLPATGLLVALCVLRLLRLRRVRPLDHVVAGLVGCAATAGVGVISVLVARPEWVPLVTVSCVALLLVASSGGRHPDALRRGWWGDVAEVVLVTAVPPLLVMVWWSGWGV